MRPTKTSLDAGHFVVTGIGVRMKVSIESFKEFLRVLAASTRPVIEDPDLMRTVLTGAVDPCRNPWYSCVPLHLGTVPEFRPNAGISLSGVSDAFALRLARASPGGCDDQLAIVARQADSQCLPLFPAGTKASVDFLVHDHATLEEKQMNAELPDRVLGIFVGLAVIATSTALKGFPVIINDPGFSGINSTSVRTNSSPTSVPVQYYTFRRNDPFLHGT